jgi:hypothetical protein
MEDYDDLLAYESKYVSKSYKKKGSMKKSLWAIFLMMVAITFYLPSIYMSHAFYDKNGYGKKGSYSVILFFCGCALSWVLSDKIIKKLGSRMTNTLSCFTMLLQIGSLHFIQHNPGTNSS